MALIKDDPTPRLAARIRAQRQARGWSLDAFARASGVSKAMLSKIERGEASPTAALLGRISGALGLTLSSLLADPADASGRLVRAAEQPTWRDPATGYVRRQLSPLSHSPLQLVEVQLPARKTVRFPASAYAFLHQLIWVISGTLTFIEGSVTHVLQPGDCLELGEPADCAFRNRSAKACRYLVAVWRRG